MVRLQAFWGRVCACLYLYRLYLMLHVSRMQLGWKVLAAANRDVLAPKKITVLIKNNGCAKYSARLNKQSNQGPLWGKSSWWLRKYQRHLDVVLQHRSFSSMELKEFLPAFPPCLPWGSQDVAPQHTLLMGHCCERSWTSETEEKWG